MSTALRWTTGGHRHLHHPRWDRAAGGHPFAGTFQPRLLDWTAGPGDGLHVHVAQHGTAAVLLAHRHGRLHDVAACRRVRLDRLDVSVVTREMLHRLDGPARQLLDAYEAWGVRP